MRLLKIPESKTGAKLIPLSKPIEDLLRSLPKVEGNPYVCPGTKEGGHLVGIQRPWQRIRKRAGLDKVRLHDLRHSYASAGVAAGMGLPLIGALLGHTQASTTQRYAHLEHSVLLEASEKVGSKLLKSINGGGEDGEDGE